MSIAVSNPGPLLGRDAEVELLVSLLDGVQDGGGALVLYGEPGIGKSRLLAVAAGLARERGFTVLSATGVQSEAHLPFAGLHQLVRPLRSRVADLPAAQRAALDAAFGLGQEPAPERFQIAMAVLDLLGEVATGAPLLILAEDAQWLDHPTTEVLAFVARRLQSDPVVLLAAVREGYPSPLVDAGLPQHRLGGLGPAEAMTLLDASAQQLSPVVRDRLLSEAAGNPLVHRDTDAARFLGPAAVAVGAFDIVAAFLAEAVEGLRRQGRLGHLPRMLTLQGNMAAHVADWGVAIPAAEEARRLATELGEPQWVAAADTVDSIIAGIRGDQDEAERAAARAERIAVPAGANLTIAFAQFGRIFAALGAGRHSDAYEAAERLLDPASPAHHRIIACGLIGELAEAALHTGRINEARARVTQVEAMSGDIPGTSIAIGLLHARALLARDPEEAAGRFGEAFGANLTHWPVQRARLLLAYGQWLRRQRRIADSRAPLRDARDAFDAMGCAAWGDQARRELRASGESSRRRDLAPRDQLTVQELQIAQLAAQGLSNRDIAQRLYLSHRTIGTHLYRIFPKLGITGRGELSSALSARTAWPER